MANQSKTPLKRGPAPEGASGAPGAGLMTAILVGVVILIAIALWNMTETRGQKAALNERLALLENQVTALGSKVDAAAKAAQPRPQQQGPDPSRVYTIRTEGAPSKGPSSAPVTIAEISDFQ